MSYEPHIGEIMLWAGNFTPYAWVPCDGRLLSISEYAPLYSLLGTTYGGDGRSTFGVPDLRGRTPLHRGPVHPLGSANPSSRLTYDEVSAATSPEPAAEGIVALVAEVGGTSTPPSYLALNYVICVDGFYPSRS